ncbi:hypothetical protein ACHAWX_000383 [Stephanocyclus meneghinianus]
MSPPRQSTNNNQLSARSPDFTSGRATTPTSAHFYNTHRRQQNKLPHGVTIQEFKEMTRARLAVEANHKVDSVHSGGTREEGQQDRTSTREYTLPLPLPLQNINYCAPIRKNSTDGVSTSSVPSNTATAISPAACSFAPAAASSVSPPTNAAASPSMHYPNPCYPSPVYHQRFHNNKWSPLRARSSSFGKPRTTTGETFSAASEFPVRSKCRAILVVSRVI